MKPSSPPLRPVLGSPAVVLRSALLLGGLLLAGACGAHDAEGPSLGADSAPLLRPAVAGAPVELLGLGAESRRGFRLPPGAERSLRATSRPGSELRFAYAGPALRLRLEVDGERHEREFAASASWNSQRLSLVSFLGRELEFVFTAAEPSLGGEGAGAAAAPAAELLLSEPVIVTPAAAPPTVVLVTSDTHRADHLGAAKSGVDVETPVLDGLAERGILFTSCFTSTNLTNPSHMALMTGVHPRDTRIMNNRRPLGAQAQTLAERFRAGGFATFASVSTAHLAHRWSGLGQGFDRMVSPRRDDWNAEDAIAELERWLPDAAGAPLFVWLHVFDAHSPYGPPGAFDRRYYPAERDPFDPSLPDPGIEPDDLLPWLSGLRDLDFPRAQYRAEVDYLDSALGDFFAVPRVAAGILAVTSDHGEALAEHGVYFDHAGLYPQTLHVPLILAYPGAPAGERREARVRQIDVGRTLLDLAGLAEAEFPGSNLTSGDPPPAVFAFEAGRRSVSITVSDWHLVFKLDDRVPLRRAMERTEKHRVELDNLAQDPACEQDVLEAHFTRAKGMRTALLRWVASAAAPFSSGPDLSDPELLEKLARLGYVDVEPAPATDLYDADCGCEWCVRFR